MTLRAATLDDLGAIMALEHATFPTDAWSRAAMRAELASPHNWYLVDDLAGDVVGYAGLRASRGAKDADIQTIAVGAASRGRGRGRALLAALLREAAGRGVREVFLEVRADNPVAQALYASEGFAQIGRRPRYYQPDDVDALVMRLDLAGWVAARPSVPAASAARPAADASTSENPANVGASAADPPTSARFFDVRAAERARADAGWCT